MIGVLNLANAVFRYSLLSEQLFLYIFIHFIHKDLPTQVLFAFG